MPKKNPVCRYCSDSMNRYYEIFKRRWVKRYNAMKVCPCYEPGRMYKYIKFLSKFIEDGIEHELDLGPVIDFSCPDETPAGALHIKNMRDFINLRAINILINHGMTKLSDLTPRSYEDLHMINGIGKKALREIQDCLKAHGLSLRNYHECD